MEFPKIKNTVLLERLELPPGQLKLVLDTDTKNEIDDQFALVYALKSPGRLDVQAVYAAPFKNETADDPQKGMELSYDEIFRVMGKMKYEAPGGFVKKGSTRFLQSIETPCESEAAKDLIDRAMNAEETLYVVAIGAITNVASAIIMEPRIIEKIKVVWLGGTSLHWDHASEFNLKQDIPAIRLVLDCGVPFVHIACYNVASHLITTVAELEKYIDGKNDIGTYLTDIFRARRDDHLGYSRPIWDASAIAYMIDPDWVETRLVHSPILTDNVTWSSDKRRHFIKTAIRLDRNKIFRDMFEKINMCP